MSDAKLMKGYVARLHRAELVIHKLEDREIKLKQKLAAKADKNVRKRPEKKKGVARVMAKPVKAKDVLARAKADNADLKRRLAAVEELVQVAAYSSQLEAAPQTAPYPPHVWVPSSAEQQAKNKKISDKLNKAARKACPGYAHTSPSAHPHDLSSDTEE
jgi:hypothetical protein